MAKRQRTRPGQRPPSRPNRPVTRPATGPSRPAGTLSEAEEARAAELEQEIVARDKAAETARARGRDRRPREASEPGVPEIRIRGGGSLVAASVEYEYVRRDVLRIVRVGGLLIGLLVILFLLIDVFGVIKL